MSKLIFPPNGWFWDRLYLRTARDFVTRRWHAFAGGINKQAIAAGGAVLDAEMDRVAPVAAGGGYVPGCDHGMPSDISWQNMHHFVRRWAGITGW